MKKIQEAVLITVLAAVILSLFSCEKSKQEENKFPDVITLGIPEDDTYEAEILCDDFSVELYSSYAVIKEYKGKDRIVTVPQEVEGKDVLVIGDYCFSGNKNVEEVILPNKLRVIEKCAFEDCSNLYSVTLPSTLEKISDFAFRCTALKEIDIPENVSSIGKYAFYLTHIENVVIPQNVSVIEKYAFYGIQELKTVKLSERLCEIGERAFGGCKALETVEMYDNVSTFGDYCFSDCVSLRSLYIPKAAEHFGNAAFNGCTNLVLYVKNGSAVIEYAKKNNYNYEIVKE